MVPLSGLTTFNDFPANFQVITALKRSLGQGYVFTPVILFTGGMCIPACNGGVHPRANTPSPQGDTPKLLFLFIFTTCVSFCSQRGLCPSMHHRSHDQGGLCPLGSLSMGVSVQGVSVHGGLCPGGLFLEVSVQGGHCPGGSVWEVSVQGGLCPRGLSRKGGLCPGGGLCPRGYLSGGVSVRETSPIW